jgi:CP family cyanate transporter-like MFS transporter
MMFGLMQLVSVPAGMVLIAIGSRPRMLRPAFYLASVTMTLGVAALMVLPATLAAVPAVLLGFGLGIFPLVMVMISRSGRTTAETTAMSTLAQSVGYLLATAGPFGMGLLHSATGGWTVPLILLLAIALAQIVVAHLLTGKKLAPTAGTPTSGEQTSTTTSARTKE